VLLPGTVKGPPFTKPLVSNLQVLLRENVLLLLLLNWHVVAASSNWWCVKDGSQEPFGSVPLIGQKTVLQHLLEAEQE
jgi:hypothetical protein